MINLIRLLNVREKELDNHIKFYKIVTEGNDTELEYKKRLESNIEKCRCRIDELYVIKKRMKYYWK